MSRQGQRRDKTKKNIREFWELEAEEWGDSPQVTIRDHCFRIHELHTLLTLIPASPSLLDVGCGTGFGTLVLSRRADLTVGVDYSLEMIRWATKLRDDDDYRNMVSKDVSPLWHLGVNHESRIDFKVADLLDLKLPYEKFAAVTGQRILINLPTHEDQMRALQNLRRHATNDAQLILVEATRQGHERTDDYRARFGLPELEKYWHNNYVDESRYGEWEDHGWRITRTLGFDTYMLLSKVIYPAACGSERCKFISGANMAAMEIASLFRTRCASQEVGEHPFFQLFVDRVKAYDKEEAHSLGDWLAKHEQDLPPWDGLGHQHLIFAQAC